MCKYTEIIYSMRGKKKKTWTSSPSISKSHISLWDKNYDKNRYDRKTVQYNCNHRTISRDLLLLALHNSIWSFQESGSVMISGGTKTLHVP